MATSTARRLVALVGAGSLALLLQVPARAADPTHTAITTPTGPTSFLIQDDHQLTVTGTASADVTQVNVLCVRGAAGDRTFDILAAGVPVTGGVFATTAEIPLDNDAGPICRLRAVPSSNDALTADLSSFSGPILVIDTLQRLTQGSHTYNFDLVAGAGTGVLELSSAGQCGDGDMRTVQADLSVQALDGDCVAGLGGTSAVGAQGPIRVDGRLALLPYEVLGFAGGGSSLNLHVHAAKSGRVTWTESAPLMRCQGTDAYPPTAGQCDTVLPTGVTFTRVGSFDAAGHQSRLRDSFASDDGSRHTVRPTYSMKWSAPPTGELGFRFPGRAGFPAASAGQVVTKLPTKAATVLVRSDRHSVEGDPTADTRAVTWSRTPAGVRFGAVDPSAFAMSYTLHVPRNGSVHLGFTDSEAVLTSRAAALGKQAVAAVMSRPTITAPASGATIAGRKTVVRGTVNAGANGLPVSVTVNGQAAVLAVRTASRATFKAVFAEPPGTHTITAVARDAGGNTRSTSITVRNK